MKPTKLYLHAKCSLWRLSFRNGIIKNVLGKRESDLNAGNPLAALLANFYDVRYFFMKFEIGQSDFPQAFSISELMILNPDEWTIKNKLCVLT